MQRRVTIAVFPKINLWWISDLNIKIRTIKLKETQEQTNITDNAFKGNTGERQKEF